MEHLDRLLRSETARRTQIGMTFRAFFKVGVTKNKYRAYAWFAVSVNVLVIISLSRVRALSLSLSLFLSHALSYTRLSFFLPCARAQDTMLEVQQYGLAQRAATAARVSARFEDAKRRLDELCHRLPIEQSAMLERITQKTEAIRTKVDFFLAVECANESADCKARHQVKGRLVAKQENPP
jgi:hypothetical protein